MLHFKFFKINDGEAPLNKWLEKNYNKVIMSKEGPEIKVFGQSDPTISIMYDEAGQGTDEWRKQGLEIEIVGLKQKLFEYQQQLLENKELAKEFPADSKGRKEHEQSVVMTTSMIKIQERKIKVVQMLLDNPNIVNEQESEITPSKSK